MRCTGCLATRQTRASRRARTRPQRPSNSQPEGAGHDRLPLFLHSPRRMISLGTDLHTPLGQDRPAGKPRRRRISPIFLSSLAVTAIVLGLSFYAMQGDPALKREAATSPEAADTSVPAEQADLSAREPSTRSEEHTSELQSLM